MRTKSVAAWDAMSTRNGNSRRRRRRSFGQVFRRPQGKGWLARFPDPAGGRTQSGRPKVITRSVVSKKEGETLLTEVRRAILTGTLAPTAPAPETCDLTLLQAVDDYLESKRAEGRSERGIRRYLTSRRVIAASPIAHRLVRDLQPQDVESYMGWRKRRKWRGVRKLGSKRTDPNILVRVMGKPSNSSVNRDVALLSAALNRLVRLELLERNVSKKVKKGREPTKTRAVLSKEECRRLLDACDPHLWIFCLAALLTGARPSELRALTWGAINFGLRTIEIFRAKVGLGDAIPMHPELARGLKALKRRRGRVADDEPVFLSSKGRPNFDHRWSWNKALKRAGLHRRKGLTLYSLRHSFATHFLENGSPSDLQQLLGHASYATTERYVRAVSDRARAGIEALDVAGA